jgi:hypothetical protein
MSDSSPSRPRAAPQQPLAPHGEAAPSRADETGTRLDPYAAAYAARAHGMTASEIRALFAVASRPEIVSLAGGMPNLSALPLTRSATCSPSLRATAGPRRCSTARRKETRSCASWSAT